ncbi:uncharacterized protein ISCGN_004024 [Ixodes scapularis]
MNNPTRSSGVHCAVFGCSNNHRKRNNQRQQLCAAHLQTPCECGIVKFHRVPKDPELKRKWLSALNRKDFKPTEHTRVCSAHFVTGKKTGEDIVPQLNLGYARKVVVGRRRLVRDASEKPLITKKQRLSSQASSGAVTDCTQPAEQVNVSASTSQPTAAEHTVIDCTQPAEQVNVSASTSQPTAAEHTVIDCTQPAEQVNVSASTSQPTAAEHTVTDCTQAAEQVNVSASTSQPTAAEHTFNVSASTSQPTAAEHTVTDCTQAAEQVNVSVSTSQPTAAEHTTTDHGQVRPDVCHQGIQWEDPCLCDHAYSRPTAPTATFGPHGGRSIEARDIFFYTGLHADVFMELVKVVPEFATTNFMMSVEQQVLLTLMKLRLGLVYGDLSRRFGVSVSTVGNIFRAMLATLGRILRNVVVWLSRETIFRNVPQSFEENGFAGTTCILDCTEVFLQRPKKLLARAQTYSSYKGHNTVKFLVAIAPHGSVMFVSKVYGGRASDKHIVRDSGIISYFQHGDQVMADRGFSLDPEMEAKGVVLNVPAFTRGKLQLSEREVTETRRIASVRIHVERAINRIKSYRILKQALPIQHRKVANEIVYVCAGLCNLKGPLIKK